MINNTLKLSSPLPQKILAPKKPTPLPGTQETFQPSRQAPSALSHAVLLGTGLLGVASPATAQAPQVLLQVQAQATLQPQKLTFLQKHLSFFDGNHDGQLTRSETAVGLRRLGLGRAKSEAVATFINVGVGVSTSDHWYDPTTINLAKIHHAKHGSDTGIFDAQGDFVPEKFNQLFERFDTDKDQSLSQGEITKMHEALKTDKVGDFASKGEFSLLMDLAGEPREVDGQPSKVLTRDTLQSFYDGTLFYKLVGEKPPF